MQDVVEAMEGAIAPAPCVATRAWRKLRDDIKGSLSSFTPAALAREAREIGPPAANYSIWRGAGR